MTPVLVGVERSTKNAMGNNTMTEEVFEKELAMCRKLHHEKKGCHWGKCENCGVIPLLYKIHKGVILEDEASIREIKEAVFGEPI